MKKQAVFFLVCLLFALSSQSAKALNSYDFYWTRNNHLIYTTNTTQGPGNEIILAPFCGLFAVAALPFTIGRPGFLYPMTYDHKRCEYDPSMKRIVQKYDDDDPNLPDHPPTNHRFYSPDGKTTFDRLKMRVFRNEHLSPEFQINNETFDFVSIRDWSPNSRYILFSTKQMDVENNRRVDRHALYLYDTETEESIKVSDQHVRDTVWGPSDTIVFIIDSSLDIGILNVADLASVKEKQLKVRGRWLTNSPVDKNIIIFLSEDWKEIKQLKLDDFSVKTIYGPTEQKIDQVAFSPNGRWLAFEKGKDYYIWELDKSNPVLIGKRVYFALTFFGFRLDPNAP